MDGMIIKRQYETFGMLYLRDPKAKELLIAACEGEDEGTRNYVLNPDNDIIVHYADMGCGLRGDKYNVFLKKLNELDQTDPYDNGLSYRDVIEIEHYPSRQGRAVRLIMWSRRLEEPRRIVKVIALEDEKVIEDWDVRKPNI